MSTQGCTLVDVIVFRLLPIFIIASSGLSQASTLSPEQVYAKCYALITSMPVEPQDPVYLSIKAGDQDPVFECIELIKMANFEGDKNQRKLQVSNARTKSIIATFHQLHSSWFTSIMEPARRRSYTQVDHTEPALYITDALFSEKPVSSIVTANYGLRGVRSGGGEKYFTIGKTAIEKQRYVMAPMKVSKTTDPNYLKPVNFAIRAIAKAVSLGDLVGVRTSRVLSLPANIIYYKSKIATKDYPSERENKKTLTLNQHYGAGAVGSAGSFMNNSELIRKGDGGQNVHRRWANNFVTDLMCLELPSLSENDIKSEISRYKKSKLGFRGSSACLNCHATLDNFAHTARNVAFVLTASGRLRNSYRTKVSKDKSLEYHVTRFPRRFDVKTNTQSNADVDKIYHRRRPDGKLWYRNFDGDLVKKNVVGISQLGREIAKQDDLYVCLAKRYFKYFTGIDIPLYGVDQSNAFAVSQREKVIKLGRDLKAHKSIRKLLRSIISDESFQIRNPSILSGGINE